MNIREKFDKLVAETTDYVASETPSSVIKNLNSHARTLGTTINETV